MVDFEQSLRNLAEIGQAAVCVPAAFKDAGIDVPQRYFIEAALKSTMNPEELAKELGLARIEKNQDIEKTLQQYEALRRQGIYCFIRIGRQTDIGIVGQHLNSIVGVDRKKGKNTLILGGIPPFGEEKGNTFALDTLRGLMPEKDGIFFYKKEEES